MIQIEKREAGEFVLLRITNTQGAYVELLNHGARIVSVVVPDGDNNCEKGALRYNRLQDYRTDKFHLGATIGRFSNRITNGCFEWEGVRYELDKNDGENSNHGGFSGFAGKLFDYRIEHERVVFFTDSLDGEGGFPGNIHFEVIYSFSEDNELKIVYETFSDRDVPVNFTNHAYFNLSGKRSTILNHRLRVNADSYLEADNLFLPTGRILPVDHTAFDFSDFKAVKEMIPLKKDHLEGFNTYYPRKKNTDTPVATLMDPSSGRVLDVYTSMPGILFYTGDFLAGEFVAFQGACLEAQYYPDGVNHLNFEVNVLSAGKLKVDTITYHFHYSLCPDAIWRTL